MKRKHFNDDIYSFYLFYKIITDVWYYKMVVHFKPFSDGSAQNLLTTLMIIYFLILTKLLVGEYSMVKS